MNIKKFICSIIAVVMLFGNISATTLALTIKEEANSSQTFSFYPVCFAEYSTVTWPTIDDAKDYYGWDRTYYSCSHYHAGVTYNYYFVYDCGDILYFVVDFDDDIDPWSLRTGCTE